MKYLINFIEKKSIKKTKIFSHLKCTKLEAKILRFICKKYVSGEQEVLVLEILKENFPSTKYEYLLYLSTIKHIINLGWLTEIDLGEIKSNDTLNLEILNISVSPSNALLKLLERGSLKIELPEIKPYTDHLEYLQNQFDLVEISYKMHSYKDNILGLERLKKRFTLLSKRIEERIDVTKEPIIVEKFLKDNNLNQQEKRIFLALLKEEYSQGDGRLREMNTLIDIISFNDYDKIKNRSLLEDNSPLISKNIIDYEEMLTPFGGISRSFYLQDDIIKQIIHPNKKKKVSKLKLDFLISEQDIFEYIHPQTALEDVVLHKDTKAILNSVIQQVDKDVFKKLKSWGIKDSKKKTIDAKIIFYGVAGTGKTMTAMSLAKTLKKPILSLDCSKILSMYVGESEKNVRKIFDKFKELSKKAQVEPILLLNEADQFLSSRNEGQGGSVDKMHNQMQNIFLEQIERFEGILIATTNLIDNIDKAFSRRFNYKVEFKKPTIKQRLRLWQLMLPENADFTDNFDIDLLTRYELTGGQINLIIKNSAYKVAIRDESIFAIEDFLQEIKKEMGNSFDKTISMGFKI